MKIHIDKGDYLTFAAIGATHGLPVGPWWWCEKSPGVWRRHWDLKPGDSRSDISRDGYLGVLYWCSKYKDSYVVKKIINAGWKRKWKMGERGNWDYINMLPLVPLMYAVRYGKWVPTPPTLPIGRLRTGFRAHLIALTIMIERTIGKRRWSHKWAVRRLVRDNPDSPLFRALHNKVLGIWPGDRWKPGWQPLSMKEGAYGWGSCPGEVYKALVESLR